MTQSEATDIYLDARREYRGLAPYDVPEGEFKGNVERAADAIATQRLRASYRFFTSPARARAARSAGKEYPEESLPTLDEWTQAADQALENLRRAIDEGVVR